MTASNPLPRGIRNNNPGNVRLGSPWDGLAPHQTDPAFCQFIDPEHGIRAIAKILMSYQDIHGLHTVRGMIGRWAPPTENDTRGYAKFVADRCGVGLDDVASIHNMAFAAKMIAAMIAMECAGYAYPADVVIRGLIMAGVGASGSVA